MTKQEKKEQGTKEKIVATARELFSEQGFNGTSVRQIAERADVNVAAINYHFGSKLNLYWAVIDEAFNWIANGVANVVAGSDNIEQLSRSLYRFLRSGEHYVVSTMKAFLSGANAPPDAGHPYHEKLDSEYMGPPGGETVVAFLREKHGEEVPLEAVEWAVLSIFSSTFHFATMLSSESCKRISKKMPTDQEIEDSIGHMAIAVEHYMCSNKKWF